MTEKELIQKLNNLKEIKPDNQWKIESREILYSQISNSTIQKSQSVFVAIREFFAKPSFAVVGLMAFFIVGSILGVNATNNLRPGDSLYIAQIISEKAQLVITFDKEEKNNLELKFANERAKKIAQVLSEASVGTDDNSNPKKNDKLLADFKKEINIVREKINDRKTTDNNIAFETEEEEEEEVFVMGASMEKEEQGLQISENNTEESGIETKDNDLSADLTQEDSDIEVGDTHKKLEEAETLFDNKDYDGAFNKLTELEAILNNEELSEEIQELKDEYEAEIINEEDVKEEVENIDQLATSTKE